MTFTKKAAEFNKYLCDFCQRHHDIYIYGAGYYGKLCFRFLQKKGIYIAGFITTDGGEDVEGYSVYKAKEVLKTLQSDRGIILAVKSEYQKEIKKKFSFPCDTLEVSDEESKYLQAFVYSERVPTEEKYPFIKKLMSSQWDNILVVQLEFTFGDMMWSTAFCRELRRNFPHSNIVLIMNSKLYNLYRNCPYIDKIVLYECDTLLREISEEIENKANEFMKANFPDTLFDVVFLPKLLPLFFQGSQGCWENVFLALASGAKNRIAHAMYISDLEKYMCDKLSGLFTVVAKHTEGRHEVLQKLDMLSACGGQYVDDKMECWIDDQDKVYASSILSKLQLPDDVLLVAVAMAASSGARSWDPYKYGNVFQDIYKKYNDKIKFLLCGGTDASKVAAVLPESQKKNCIDITGKTTLTEAAAVINNCSIYLGSDTGLLHMASTFGVPVIEISASNMHSPDYWLASPTRHGPWKTDAIVLRPDNGLDECEYLCTRPYAHCINQITEEQVENALEEMVLRIGCFKHKRLKTNM